MVGIQDPHPAQAFLTSESPERIPFPLGHQVERHNRPKNTGGPPQGMGTGRRCRNREEAEWMHGTVVTAPFLIIPARIGRGNSGREASAYYLGRYPASLSIRFRASLGSTVSTSYVPFVCRTVTLTVCIRSNPCMLII